MLFVIKRGYKLVRFFQNASWFSPLCICSQFLVHFGPILVKFQSISVTQKCIVKMRRCWTLNFAFFVIFAKWMFLFPQFSRAREFAAGPPIMKSASEQNFATNCHFKNLTFFNQLEWLIRGNLPIYFLLLHTNCKIVFYNKMLITNRENAFSRNYLFSRFSWKIHDA